MFSIQLSESSCKCFLQACNRFFHIFLRHLQSVSFSPCISDSMLLRREMLQNVLILLTTHLNNLPKRSFRQQCRQKYFKFLPVHFCFNQSDAILGEEGSFYQLPILLNIVPVIYFFPPRFASSFDSFSTSSNSTSSIAAMITFAIVIIIGIGKSCSLI